MLCLLYTLMGGGGGKCPLPFLSLGAHVSPINYQGGRCPHIPFFIGGKCPRGQMSYTLLFTSIHILV